MRANDLRGIAEGLTISKRLIESAAERALLDGELARDPYKSQMTVLNGHTMILALFGGNQCLSMNSRVIQMCGSYTPISSVEIGDWILGYEKAAHRFIWVQVKGIHINEARPILRFRHQYGAPECTASHKVMRVLDGPNRERDRFLRISRCWRNQYPVIVRSPDGNVEMSLLDFDGQVDVAESIDLIVDHPDHAFVAENIVVSNSGKSHSAAHKVGWDAMGMYPEHGWYHGTRTNRGIDIWVVGDTNENTRDNCQKKLFGPDPDRPGWTDTPGENALIPQKYIVGKPTRRTGVAGAFDSVFVKHVPSDTLSKITFKSHAMDQQALASWTGDLVWIDEEAPKEKFDELLMRIIRRKGQLILSFTPLLGVTPMVKFLLEAPPDLVTKDFLDWDQARHLDATVKAAIMRAFASQPGILQARMKGLPSVNTGLIFPFDQKAISYDPSSSSISTRWLYLGGLDVGFRHPTGAIALAWDPRSDVAMLYSTYRQAERTYLYHHTQLQGWGANMTYMIDPASSQSSPGEGVKVLEKYWELAHGENWMEIPEEARKYIKAENAWQLGIDELWHRFETGRLKVNQNCKDWFEEYGSYVWDKAGLGPLKKRDDLMDPTRYGVLGLRQYAHRLDEVAPWRISQGDPGFEGVPDVREWNPYRAGRTR